MSDSEPRPAPGLTPPPMPADPSGVGGVRVGGAGVGGVRALLGRRWRRGSWRVLSLKGLPG